MAYDQSGQWTPEDQGVATRIAKITSGTSDYMRQARTSGKQSANRRGLGNSSMAAGASEAAAISAATPIASQEAGQIAQQNLTRQNSADEMDRLTAQLAAAERENLANSATTLSANRLNAFSNTLNNAEIPADVRAAAQSSINAQHDSTFDYLQSLYGITAGSNSSGGSTTPTAPAIAAAGDVVYVPGPNGEQIPVPASVFSGRGLGVSYNQQAI